MKRKKCSFVIINSERIYNVCYDFGISREYHITDLVSYPQTKNVIKYITPITQNSVGTNTIAILSIHGETTSMDVLLFIAV